jgi:GNAT superfamily N-acetyltransferase
VGNIDIEVRKNTTDIQLDSLERLMREFDSIADQIWQKEPTIYKDLEAFYFNETTGVALATDHDRLVAYSIYKRVQMFGKTVLHSASTTVRPEYQSAGLRSRFLKSIVHAEQCFDSPGSMFLSVRTRNPINWHVFSRCCDPIVPDYRNGSMIEAELVDLGVAVAKEIYPTLDLERPTMIMRNAFDWLRYLNQPLHKDAKINEAFFRDLSGTDGIFAIGRARTELLAT